MPPPRRREPAVKGEQLALSLPVREARGRGDFLVAPANATALAWVEAWRGWPQGKLLLTGPEAAGKTHLAQVWAVLAGAAVVPAADLAGRDLPALATGPLAVEDGDRLAGDAEGERALFHLHNLMQAAGHPLLLTARAAPAAWGLALPDLASRVAGTQAAAIAPPDDALLAAVLVKHFADRQLDVTPPAIDYLLRHMERSFAAAGELAGRLDRAALAQRRPVTRVLAREVLDNPAGARE